MRMDYLALLVRMEVDIIDSGVEIPTLPENCDADAHTALEALNAKDMELEDCLSYKTWINNKIDELCNECYDGIMAEIDY